MTLNRRLKTYPREIRVFITTFVFVMSVGFFTGLFFIRQTSSTHPSGIERNYLGNEEEPEAEVMIFKKSEREMLTIIHTHILSLSLLFFLLGILVWITELPTRLKYFLTVEPFISLIFTFGGIYLLWRGILWMKYVVFFSGMLMTITYLASATIVVYQALRPGKPT
jgi:hypothetical protein